MRLEFNYVVIDDDFSDVDDRSNIDSLIEKINKRLESKGFIPIHHTFVSKSAFEQARQDSQSTTEPIVNKRIDLYLSDNNLGNSGGQPDNNEHAHDGIEIYINLKQNFPCDFVLYTRSNATEIINKMVTFLQNSKNPDLFSRFNFIARETNEDWHNKVLEIIDFIITKREEMNILRGLFAEKISAMDIHLKKILGSNPDENFKKTLDNIPKKYFQNSKISDIKKFLNNLRQIRNALLHCNEEFDTIRREYKITYKDENSGKEKYILEKEFEKHRKQLLEVYEEVMSWT